MGISGVSGHWRVLAGIGGYGWVSAEVGAYWWVSRILTGIRSFLWISASICRCRPALAGIGGHRLVLDAIGGHGVYRWGPAGIGENYNNKSLFAVSTCKYISC